ncbi:MAG: hypothetical protein RR905_05795 [Aurantimicrobium sp.]
MHPKPHRNGELDHLGGLELNTHIEPVSVTTGFNTQRGKHQELQTDGDKQGNVCPLTEEHQWKAADAQHQGKSYECRNCLLEKSAKESAILQKRVHGRGGQHHDQTQNHSEESHTREEIEVGRFCLERFLQLEACGKTTWTGRG